MDEKNKALFEDELRLWNKVGVFASDNDTEESFKEKIKYLTPFLGFLENEGFTEELDMLEKLYAIQPSWLKVIFSNKNLRFWEAGCVWSDGEEEILSIQLRKEFQNKERFLFLYRKGEVMMHECVHAVRSPLNSHVFDEFFAYSTSNNFGSTIRAFFGPLYTSIYEVYFSLFISFFSTLLFMYAIFFDVGSILLRDELYYLSLFFIPFAVPLFAFLRLIFRWQTFYRCKKNVCKMLEEMKSQLSPLQFMIRLKDKEIKQFSYLSSELIRSWIENEKKVSLRWRQLSYFLEF